MEDESDISRYWNDRQCTTCIHVNDGMGMEDRCSECNRNHLWEGRDSEKNESLRIINKGW